MTEPKRHEHDASHRASVDQQSEDSFPASDAPSFSGGNHIIGAPEERQSHTRKLHPEKKARRARTKKARAH